MLLKSARIFAYGLQVSQRTLVCFLFCFFPGLHLVFEKDETKKIELAQGKERKKKRQNRRFTVKKKKKKKKKKGAMFFDYEGYVQKFKHF